jgi:lambda family phage portal protein
VAVNVLDAVIEAVAPRWAAKRAVARATLRSFNATGRGRRQNKDGWTTGPENPTETSMDLAILRERERDMARNNPYWRQGVRVLTSEVIGRGIRATAIGDNQRTVDSVQRAWDEWAESKTPDVTGQQDLYGLQRLITRSVVSHGECLVYKRVVDRKLRLQLLSADYLDISKDRELPDGGQISGGIETDQYGAPVAYHLYPRHPSRVLNGESKRVLAGEVAHVFSLERIGQLRGESFLASVYTRLSDWDDYEDADLMRAKVAACFGVVYTGVDGDSESDVELREKIEPGMIEHLPNGAQVQTLTPPANLGLRDSALINHRAVALGLGITYESLTGDYEKVTFSSARMGRIQMDKWISDLQQDVLIDRFCQRVWAWFLNVNTLRSDDQNTVQTPRVTAQWTAPSRSIVDPNAESKASLLDVRAGFRSWSDAVRERGMDPQRVAEQIAKDQKLFDGLGIVLDSDPRKVSIQGQGAVNQQGEEGEANGGASKATKA